VQAREGLERAGVERVEPLDDGGLSIDALGALHGVHRATCARWIASARHDILAALRKRLRGGLGLDHRDIESAIALVRSRLDLSLSRHLR
jgi:RNA polymerase sigma-70 factor (ECF subfamily)